MDFNDRSSNQVGAPSEGEFPGKIAADGGILVPANLSHPLSSAARSYQQAIMQWRARITCVGQKPIGSVLKTLIALQGKQPTIRQLTSGSTWWYKKAFPMIWFGFLAFMMLAMLPSIVQERTPAPMVLVPLGMSAFGYILMRGLIWPLGDEVYLDGDDVIVRNKGEEDRFPFSNVINVQASEMTNPERITLNLKQPCLFGDEIKFMPPARWFKLGKHPVATELINRIRDRE